MDSVHAKQAQSGQTILLPHRALTSLSWWENRETVCVEFPFILPPSTKRLITDAPLLEWGALLDEHIAQGTWTHQESQLHVNLLELHAVYKACKKFLPFIWTFHIQVMSENMTTVYYFNKQGGESSPPLCIEAVNLELSQEWTF